MAKQTVTIEVDVPEGMEATGNLLAWKHDAACLIGGQPHIHCLLAIRPKWRPPAYLPEGCFVYRNGKYYNASHQKPVAFSLGYTNCGECVSCHDLAALHGETFVPPPVDLIQVHHEQH